MMCVYKMYCKEDPSLFYIGSTINLQVRMNRHLRELRLGIHKNKSLQTFYNHISENFCFEVLKQVEDATMLLQYEQAFLNKLSPVFNIQKTAKNTLGKKHKPETIVRLKEIKKGKQSSLGRVLSEETKEKIRQRQTGKVSKKKIPVLCLQNNKIYPSVIEAAKELMIPCPGFVGDVCRGKRKTAHGYSFQYVKGDCSN